MDKSDIQLVNEIVDNWKKISYQSRMILFDNDPDLYFALARLAASVMVEREDRQERERKWTDFKKKMYKGMGWRKFGS